MLPIDYSRRLPVTQSILLAAIRDRIREVTGLNDQNAVVSDQPMPKDSPPGGRLFVSVCAGPSQFADNNVGHSQLSEDGTTVVSIFVQSFRDKLTTAEAKIIQDEGLMFWKGRVLAKLLVDDPTKKQCSPHWEPTITRQGEAYRFPILNDALSVIDCSDPFDAWKGWCGISMSFHTSFNWDLYGNN